MADELKADALSLVDSVVMAVAGAAPAYSITATTAALTAAVGAGGPGSLLYAALPMCGVSVAFMYLNRWRPDAGAGYTWVGRAISPSLGFMAGWTLLTLSTIFMVAASVPAAEATLDLVAPGRAGGVGLVTAVGAAWFLLVVALTMVGVHLAAEVQTALLAVEVVALAVLVGAAFLHPHVRVFAWSWVLPSGAGGARRFMSGMLVATFFYFGWDVSANLAEETRGSSRTAGLAGVLGVIAVVGLFMLVQVAIQLAMGDAAILAHPGDVLPALGDELLGRPWGALAVIAVLTSTIGTLETQILQCARTLFSMGRDRVVSPRFAELHPTYRTPWLASATIGLIALALFAVSGTSPTVGALMSDLINAVSVQVALYYGVCALACAVYHRRSLRRGALPLLTMGVWPVASAVFLAGAGALQLPQFGLRASLLSLGTIAAGLLPLAYYRVRHGSAFYSAPLEAAGEA